MLLLFWFVMGLVSSFLISSKALFVYCRSFCNFSLSLAEFLSVIRPTAQQCNNSWGSHQKHVPTLFNQSLDHAVPSSNLPLRLVIGLREAYQQFKILNKCRSLIHWVLLAETNRCHALSAIPLQIFRNLNFYFQADMKVSYTLAEYSFLSASLTDVPFWFS